MSLSGIFPALLTPYDAKGLISAAATTALVQRLNEQGAGGYFVSGSSAECYLLTTEERLEALQTIHEAAEGRPLIFHVGAGDHRETIELARTAEQAGAAAVCANIPTYFSYGDGSLKDYYRQLRSATDLPLLAYYIPSQTGRLLEADFFFDLAAEGVIQGIKYTDSDLGLLSALLAERPEDFVAFAGADNVLLGALALGADGGIGSSYNIVCRLYVELFDRFRNGDVRGAQALQRQAVALLNTMAGWEFIGHLKSVCRLRGIDLGMPRLPMHQPTSDEIAKLADQLNGLADVRPYLI